MISPTARPVRWLAAVVALLLAVGLVAAVTTGDGDGGDDDTRHGTGASSRAPEAPGGDPAESLDDAFDAAPAPGGGAPGTGSPAGGRTPAEASASSGARPPADAGRLPATAAPPRAGLYRFNIRDDRGTSEERERVSVDGRNVTYTRSGGREDWEWDGKAASLTAIRIEGDEDGEEQRCRFEPAVLRFAFPIRAGSTWSGAGRCRTDGDGPSSFAIDTTIEARVSRAAEATVGGETTAVWVIEVVERTKFRLEPTGAGASGAVNADQEFRGTLEFSPSTGLVVRRAGTSSTTQNGQRSERSNERVLLSLRPE